jgi:hypothetical protein
MAQSPRPRRTRLRDLIAAALVATTFSAAEAGDRRVTFPGAGAARAVTLGARLTLPDDVGAAALPAVVVMPDLPGPGGDGHRRLVVDLRRHGLVVLVVDGFAARGLEGSAEAARLPILRRIEDAYAALAWLRTQPGIDGARIALVGVGAGADVAVQAGLAHLRDIARARGRFLARVAQAPGCSLQWREVATDGSPLMIQAPGAGGIGATSHCEDWARRLRQGDGAVEMRHYAGLAPVWEAPPFLDEAGHQTDRCLALLDGSVTDRATGLRHTRDQIAGWIDGCRAPGRRGGGGPADQRDRAAADLAQFLGSHGMLPLRAVP